MAQQDDQSESKIHVDSDWKAQAQREKEQMARKRQQQAAAPGAGETASTSDSGQSTDQGQPQSEQPQSQQEQAEQSQQLPDASFETLSAMLATQALLYLGEINDPQSGQQMIHLDLAKHHIDLLGVLEDKTRGNLSDDEQKSLASTVYELRSRYVRISAERRQKG